MWSVVRPRYSLAVWPAKRAVGSMVIMEMGEGIDMLLESATSATRAIFELTTAPNVIWTDLKKLNISEGARVMKLNPNTISISAAM